MHKICLTKEMEQIFGHTEMKTESRIHSTGPQVLDLRTWTWTICIKN